MDNEYDFPPVEKWDAATPVDKIHIEFGDSPVIQPMWGNPPVATWDFHSALGETLKEKYGETVEVIGVDNLWNTEGTGHDYEQWQEPTNADDFVPPTFESFLTTDELKDIAAHAGTIAAWDFNTSFGDTIKEKYESLYVKAVEVTNVLLKKGAKGYFWIVTSPEVASVFETATVGFYPTGCYEDEPSSTKIGGVYPMGIPSKISCFVGTINSKWRLYKNADMPTSMILIGCNDKLEDYTHYARLNIYNFVI